MCRRENVAGEMGKKGESNVNDGQQHVRYKLTPTSLAFLFIGKLEPRSTPILPAR